MGVKYGKFELPTKIKVDDAARKPNFCRFIAEAFERGYGHTLGNGLRRILLTSMEAPAIISVRIEGILHEYTAAEGIVEDMTHIILNLKGALLRKLPTEEVIQARVPKQLTKVLDVTAEQIAQNGGHYLVTLKDLIDEPSYELVNPDLPIFTATKPQTRRVDIKVAIGRGYVPSERHEIVDKVADEIVIDSIFSPVRLVNYFVENTRVGQDTDYDRLILEVTTDGRITPEEALSFATQIGIHHFKVFEELQYMPISFDEEEETTDADREAILAKLALKINEIELSVRSTNCLQGANIETIGELVMMPESEMLKFRNFGKKSLTEIKQKLDEMGLFLGMDLSKIGITRENVGEVVAEYLSEKAGKEAL
jgi:DNA-directed RNA polymerase subunit alpha